MAEAMINLQHQSTIPSLGLPTPASHPQSHAHAHAQSHATTASSSTMEAASTTTATTSTTTRMPVHHMSHSHVQVQRPQQQQQQPPQQQPAQHNPNPPPAPPAAMHSHPAMIRNSAGGEKSTRIHGPQPNPTSSTSSTNNSGPGSTSGSGGAATAAAAATISPRRNSKVMFDLSHQQPHAQQQPQHQLPQSSSLYHTNHQYHGGGGSSNKRHKPNAQITAQHVIMGIQQGITGQDRREAIHNACAAFDHGVEIAHDDEIKVGADAVLFKHLTFLLYKRSLVRDQRLKMKQQQQRMMMMDVESRVDGKAVEHRGNGNGSDIKKKEEEEEKNDCDWNGEDIHNAITRTRSTSAESEASTSFGGHHNNRHNASATATVASQTQSQQLQQAAHDEEEESLMEEVCTTLSGLEMVLRCSADCISSSFDRIGQELLYILITFMEEELDKRQQVQVVVHQEEEDQSGDASMKKEGHPNDVQGESGTNTQMNMEVEDTKTQTKVENNTNTSASTNAVDKADNANGEPSPSPIASPKRMSPTTTMSTATATTFSASSSRATGDAIFKTATKIIGHFARVGSLTNILADAPGLLTTLRRVVAANGDVISSIHRTVPIEAKLNSLWVIANLACCAENMMKMAQHSQLLDTIVHAASHPNEQDESQCGNVTEYLQILRSRSIAVRAILNLSWAHGNKIPFTEHVSLVDALLRAASQRHSSWTGHGKGVSGYLLQTRRHAAGALRNLAAAPRRYKRRLCRFRDSHTFLETLADVATHDNDEIVREKIHATLFNLVSADTAKLFVEKQAVLDVIVKAATSMEGEGSDGTTNGNGRNTATSTPVDSGSKSMALQTLQSLEKAIPEDEEDYEVLRPVLSRFDSQVTMFKSVSRPGLATCAGQTAV